MSPSLPSLLSLSLLSLSLTLVSAGHTNSNQGSAHHALAARRAGLVAHERALANNVVVPPSGQIRRRADVKRCKIRPSSIVAPESSSSSSSAGPVAVSTPNVVLAAVSTVVASTTSTSVYVAPTTSTSVYVAPTTTSVYVAPPPPAAATTSKAVVVPGPSSGNVLNVDGGNCGWSQGSDHTSNAGGPNGLESWLTCGLTSGGWSPPYITLGQIKYADLGHVVSSGNSPFQPCAPYVDQFYAVGAQYNIPPIVIASFAMQESTCNPNVVGGGGEQGMFQITPDKCGGAPGGNCKDLTFNMQTAMAYFRNTLDGNNGNLLLAIGQYNGWYQGLTIAGATAARWGSCCRCQNNLDYLHQFLNGWVQGLNGYSYGTYFNLNVC